MDDNSGKFGGVTSFNYYGEVLDPELSNLGIFTLGGGIRPIKRVSIDLIYHYYRQHYADDDINGSNLKIDPGGDSKDVGHALDLVMGYRAIENLDVEMVLGTFIPGQAFSGNAEPAYKVGIEMSYNF